MGTSSRKLSYELRFFNFFTNEARMQCVRYATPCFISIHIDLEYTVSEDEYQTITKYTLLK